MAVWIIPSNFTRDCGHLSQFAENTVREMQKLTKKSRKPDKLWDSEPVEHAIEFHRGEPTAVLCPKRGRCPIVRVDV